MQLLKTITLLLLSIPHLSCKNAGIFPYAKQNNKIYFLVGEDKSRPNQWTDFGGHDKPGETPKETAIREFKEETGSWIKKVSITKETIWIENEKKTYRTYLVEIPYFDPEKLRRYIDKNKNKLYDLEKQDFVWIALADLIKALQTTNFTPSLTVPVSKGTTRTRTDSTITLYQPATELLYNNQTILNSIK